MSKEIGDWAEEQAKQYLRNKGYDIQASNWRYSRAEVDIIAYQSPVLVFVEVKMRKNTHFGTPASFVDKKKQQLLAEAAAVYCEATAYDGEIRFDVISLVGKPGSHYSIEHLEDAFFPGL